MYDGSAAIHFVSGWNKVSKFWVSPLTSYGFLCFSCLHFSRCCFDNNMEPPRAHFCEPLVSREKVKVSHHVEVRSEPGAGQTGWGEGTRELDHNTFKTGSTLWNSHELNRKTRDCDTTSIVWAKGVLLFCMRQIAFLHSPGCVSEIGGRFILILTYISAFSFYKQLWTN